MRNLLIVLIAASLPPTAAAAENGLVAHWKMDQIVDGVVADATGRGHDARLGGVDGVRLEVVPGVIGNAVQFRADQQTFLTVARLRRSSIDQRIDRDGLDQAGRAEQDL